jgi:hypothetical protein
MIRRGPLNFEQLLDRGLLESRESREPQRQFLVVEQQPESVGGEVRDLDRRSGFRLLRRSTTLSTRQPLVIVSLSIGFAPLPAIRNLG